MNGPITKFSFGYRRDLVIERPDWSFSKIVLAYRAHTVSWGSLYAIDDYREVILARGRMDRNYPGIWPGIRWMSTMEDTQEKVQLVYYPDPAPYVVSHWTELPGSFLDLYRYVVDEGFLRPGYDQPLNR